jgi:cytochrome bd-type quinol oxidase subunit 2
MDDAPTSVVPGQLSPDRNYYWDGRAWISSISPDGMYRWDGARWIAASPQPESRQPASRTLWVVLLAVALAVLTCSGGLTVYTVQFTSNCSQGGCGDLWFIWIFVVPPMALAGIVILIASLVIWRRQRAQRRTAAAAAANPKRPT